MNPVISLTLIVLAVTAILIGVSNAHRSPGRPKHSFHGSKCGEDASVPNDVCDVEKTNLDCKKYKITCECPEDFQWWDDIKKCRGGVKAGENCTAVPAFKTNNEADVCAHSKMVCVGGKCECPSGKNCTGGPPKYDLNGSPRPCKSAGQQFWFVFLPTVISGSLAVYWY